MAEKFIQTTVRIPVEIYNKLVDKIASGKKTRDPERLRSINHAVTEGLKKIVKS